MSFLKFVKKAEKTKSWTIAPFAIMRYFKERRRKKNIKKLHYIDNIKYQITRDYAIFIPIFPDKKISTEHISLDVDGYLFIKKTYAFDGPSGPTADRKFPWLYKKMLRPSLIHDALYELMRHGLLDREVWRVVAKMVKIRVSWCYWGVRVGGKSSTYNKNQTREKVAP
jgi:hypothetical protein